ncbi:hypothetical protein predicted by Glimmer/Critica [Bordetella petrii]|uniref:Uncharacterized protein n=1 Tax=Bordetella petrii (strain ATCC BAA-461 / DSM 12804 / CCUG 43448 / CIP 107267 / Se-1111R) TaxID=340100 RepID=A9ID71_BORPD|nr:hypothetical protein predicted by Glimmer/Critica [Bordetella petrii]
MAFGGFNPADLLEMDLEDLIWWYRQAEVIAEELKARG